MGQLDLAQKSGVREQVSRVLKDAGVRRSQSRLDVLSLLMGAEAALSHTDLMDALPVGTDRVTVYRTLQTLQDAGLVHMVNTHERGARFAASVRLPGQHAHLLCNDCGQVACVEEPAAVPLKEKKGWRIRRRQTVYYGTCPQCLAGAS